MCSERKLSITVEAMSACHIHRRLAPRLYLACGCAFVASYILFMYVALVFKSDKELGERTFWVVSTVYICGLFAWWVEQWFVLRQATWALGSKTVLDGAKKAWWSRVISFLISHSDLPKFEPRVTRDASQHGQHQESLRDEFTAHAKIHVGEAHAMLRRAWWSLWFPIFLLLSLGVGELISFIPGVGTTARYLSLTLPHMALLFVCQFNWAKIASLVDQHEAGPRDGATVYRGH